MKRRGKRPILGVVAEAARKRTAGVDSMAYAASDGFRQEHTLCVCSVDVGDSDHNFKLCEGRLILTA